MAYEGGFTSATNDASNRQSQDVYRQLAMQQAQQQAIAFAASQAAAQRQREARAGAGNVLYGMGGQVPPPPGLQPPPGTPQGGPQPQPPGTSSQPAAQMGPPPSPQGAGGAAGPSIPPPPGAGGGMPQPQAGPPPIPPFKSMPTAPPPQAGGAGGMIPPPPQPSGPEVTPQHQFDLKSMIENLKKSGVPAEKAMDMLDELTPIMSAQNKQELDFFRANNQAQKVAIDAYHKALDLALKGRKQDTVDKDVESKIDTRDQNVQAKWAGIDQKLKDWSSKQAKQMAGTISDEDAEFQANRILAGDRSGTVGFGRGAQGAENLAKIQAKLREISQKKGIDPAGIATGIAEFEGLKAGERALGTRTANFGMAKSEAYEMADLVVEASDKVDRTNFQPVNKALIAYEKNTGDVPVRQFGAAVNSFINAYARAVSPTGAPAQAEKEHARELLSTADSPEQVKGVIAQLKKEMEAAGRAPGKVKQELRDLHSGGGGAPKEGDVQDGYRFKGGDPASKANWEKV